MSAHPLGLCEIFPKLQVILGIFHQPQGDVFDVSLTSGLYLYNVYCL